MIIPHSLADCKGFCIFCGKFLLWKLVREFTFTFSFAKKFDKHLTFGGIVCIMNKYDYGSMIDVEALL